jgi:outer membrane protein OmpA-like peptidoglycan-associated protein
MIYTEHSFTYARTIFDRQTSFLKGGASIKILNGIDAKYLYANSGSINFQDSTSPIANLNDLDANFGSNYKKTQLKYKNRGLGLDIGFTYEKRPNYEDQYYEMDGSKRNSRYDINKYKWKVSGSITDIGWVRYMKDTANYNFSNAASVTNAQVLVDVNALVNFPFLTVKDSLQTPGVKSATQETKFRMNLPTSLHASFDINVKRNFYVSYNMSIPISSKSDKNKINYFFIQTVTPRLEKANWSVLMPISHMGNGAISLGAAGRFTYKKMSIFAGSNNVAFFYGQKSSLSRNIFVGVSYSVLYKVPGDKDHDKISDEKDACPVDAGLAEFNGCPDTDGDKIIDKEDHCLYIKGGRNTFGCPDTDGDWIIDMNDMCPDVKGLGVHFGCPDTDKDGVIDVADRCPDVPGLELNNGCPFDNQGCCLDDDGDGVSNKLDRCPGVAGTMANNGCPVDSTMIKLKIKEEQEKEKEKLEAQKKQEAKEKQDAINAEKLAKENPALELRKQMITTKEDLAALLAGKTILKNLNVYFDVDQSTLTEKEKLTLDNFVKTFPKKESISIMLIGYTDQDGSLDYNLILSKKRAETIQQKLIKEYGIDAKLITFYYYGESKSEHKGEYTDEMKQADRKVEIKLVRNPK